MSGSFCYNFDIERPLALHERQTINPLKIYQLRVKKVSFAERVRSVVRTIPKGKTMTYGQVAAMAGSPGAARAVGNIMKCNFDNTVPCHRVVRSDGTIGDYNRGGSDVKKKLLTLEEAL